ncbi:MAG: hypothetical protein CBR30_03190 [Dictyoglomus sp. NZ13-RE01]|nr:MAG: hypothetical protein CBR30_03190 [Dictyoglomus sp. NZ13-RE01]
MIFDFICVITILGLAIKGLKEALTNKVGVVIALIVAFLVSSQLLPFYMKYINFPSYIPSNIFAFILTFIFVYVLLSIPSLILSVIFGGILLILVYGLIVRFLPLDIQTYLTSKSIIFSFIKPAVDFIYNLLKYIL